MNPLRQFAHTLFKDIRGHWPEIGLVLLLNIVVAATLTQTWAERSYSTETPFNFATQALLIVAWCLLIVRVVQEDGPAGKAPFWLTRPGSRLALLASKLSFVTLFAHLPSFLSQLAIVIGSGVPLSLPQLLVNQAVFAACLSLPLMALAALTTTISRFALAGVAVAAPSLLVVGATLSPLRIPLGARSFYSVSTMFLAAAEIATLVLIAGIALACQYYWRATLRVTTGSLVALAVLGAGVLLLPASYVQRARAVVFGLSTAPSSIRLRSASERRLFSPDVTSSAVVVPLPIDLPDTNNQLVRYYEVDVRSTDGKRVRQLASPALRMLEGERWLDLRLAEADYDSFKESPVSVRLIVELETYETRAAEPIPYDGSFAIVAGRAQCGNRGGMESLWMVSCRTSFGWSRWFVDGPPDVDSPAEAQLMWLPIRLQFAIDPIERTVAVGATRRVDPRLRNTELATVVREPVSYTRQDVTFENVRLGDWGP